MSIEGIQLYTSNFRNAGKNPNAVAISRGIPVWYKGKRCLELAPTREMLNRWKTDPNEEGFLAVYQDEVLERLDATQVAAVLGDGAIMLCWEKVGEFCHRLAVAAWFQNELGLIVPEYEPPAVEKTSSKKKESKAASPVEDDSLSLF